jgi:cardiolipin synthase
MRPGHELRLLKGGEQFFPALIEAIDAARAEVLLETYIFEFNGAALVIAEALERAAARGVAVHVVADGVGTPDVPAEWQARWQAAGVQWRIFNPARGWRLMVPKRWRRLHRKLCSVDGQVAFCGGINLIDDLYDPNYGTLDKPRFDFAVRVVGPLVADVQDTMTRLWLRLDVGHEARRHDLGRTVEAVRAASRAGTVGATDGSAVAVPRRPARRTAAPAPDGASAESAFQAAPGGRRRGAIAGLVLRDNVRFRRRIEATYRLAIAQARSEILIANAYFIPGVRLQRALLRAARRGVRITLLLQGRYEYFMQHHASRAVYGVLLAGGIEIIEYAPSFLHAKVAVVDGAAGSISTVGSSNLDPLSLLLAREANVFVVDDAFGAELRGHLLDAVAHEGHRVESADHLKRPFRTRCLSWLAWAMIQVALFATGKRY